MCNYDELLSKAADLQEWQALLDEATAMVESIKDFIKSEMNERDVEELEVGTNICRFTSVTSNRFDSTRFKREHNDVYQMYVKQVTSKRFTIS